MSATELPMNYNVQDMLQPYPGVDNADIPPSPDIQNQNQDPNQQLDQTQNLPQDNSQIVPQEPDIDRDEFAGTIWDIVKQFERDDEIGHRKYFNEAVLSEHYWNNRQHIYKEYTGVDTFDYRVDNDDDSEDYTNNVYRPNGESIIAAMAVSEPKLNFYPDDADNADDIVAANANERIAKLIQKHNKSRTLMARILCIKYNQSFVAVYNYNKKDKKYGTYQVPQFGPKTVIKNQQVCATCQHPIEGPGQCPVCGTDNPIPQIVQTKETFTDIVGQSDEPKSRECLHAFGPLHIKIAPYAQEQADTPYLILEFEAHPSRARAEFPLYKDQLFPKGGNYSKSEFEREYRAQIYQSDHRHLDTWKCIWIRAENYECLDESDKYYTFLTQNYPDGLHAIFVNGVLCYLENENSDDHWTISVNPLSTYINSESLGKAGISVQDSLNELVNLEMSTVKHGIPQTFASTKILDFKAYEKSEVAPGNIWPVNNLPPGDNLNNHILTTKTASLSQEVKEFRESQLQMGQLATGAFPSIYGGQISGSRTASEYAQSRAQALQRLTITWNEVKQLWADVMSKACTSYARNLQEAGYDEKYVEKDGNSYINIWIRQSELQGKVGSIEPEIDEQLPTSWAQQRDVMMRLIELNSPMINSILMTHENAYVVKNGLGFDEINIPGYDDRIKQLSEIQIMMKGMPVEIDQMLDDHATEAETCRIYLIGEVGRDLKINKPQIYQLIYQHFIQHSQIAATQAAAQQQQQQQTKQNPGQSKQSGFPNS